MTSSRGQTTIRRRIGDVLIEHGVITAEHLAQTLLVQADVAPGQRRKRLGTLLVELGFATERDIATALASALGLEVIDLSEYMIPAEIARVLPRTVAERHEVMVLARQGHSAIVATSDPTNIIAIDDVKLYTGASDVELVVAVGQQLREALARAWSLASDSSEVGALASTLDTASAEDVPADAGVDDAPIVKLVNAVLSDAARAGVSDVHIEPQRNELRIRYRVDGLLRDVMTVPKGATAAVTSRIKIISGLDIAERRRPQDGRTRLAVDGMAIDVRVSTLPTMHGEKVVMRLLAKATDIPDLQASGFDETQLGMLRTALESPQGLIVICGPTGSGKTSTLYAGINEVSNPERNVVTLEDPVEIQLPGINQVQVNVKAGMTFAAGLRSVLRQDPDVVLVGEVRDAETAGLALEASLTGHLVLTTLHTNGAVEAITRLVEMGIDPFLVASSLTLVAAQRLVRRPCNACAEPYLPSPDVLFKLGVVAEDLVDANPLMGVGCPECSGSGYKGRTGVFEILTVNADMRRVLLDGGGEIAISQAAKEGGLRTLRADGITRAMRGLTTFEEILRVTHADSESMLRCGNCERRVAADMVACPWCAHDLDTGTCHGCHKALRPEWHICPYCRETTPAGDRATVTGEYVPRRAHRGD
ncbi:MAG: type secretion system protein [Cryptosporangiaceae bacterium]|nr:type secretion system protein [Cryptosporangiaceae bacterium]